MIPLAILEWPDPATTTTTTTTTSGPTTTTTTSGPTTTTTTTAAPCPPYGTFIAYDSPCVDGSRLAIFADGNCGEYTQSVSCETPTTTTTAAPCNCSKYDGFCPPGFIATCNSNCGFTGVCLG